MSEEQSDLFYKCLEFSFLCLFELKVLLLSEQSLQLKSYSNANGATVATHLLIFCLRTWYSIHIHQFTQLTATLHWNYSVEQERLSLCLLALYSSQQ